VGLFLLIMPLMVSEVIRVFGWIVILGRKGLLNQALLALGLEPVKLLYSETAVVIGRSTFFCRSWCCRSRRRSCAFAEP
jgi:ABC-type spermidine/putrescine transport system permease subunit I